MFEEDAGYVFTSPEGEAGYFIKALIDSSVHLENVQIIVIELNSRSITPTGFIEQLQRESKKKDYPLYVQQLQAMDISSLLGEDDFYVIDDHINADGHRKVAAALRPYLR